MIHRDVLQDILNIAVNAPSGDNAQPWKFKIDDATISVFNVPDKDGTLYNYKQRGSLVSHGAVIENIVIIAKQLGLAAKVEILPGERDCTAKIEFAEGGIERQELFDAIPLRATNRKPYTGEALTVQQKEKLLASAKDADGELRLVESSQLINELSSALSLNEQLLMENRELHDFLFAMIRWTKEEEQRAPGLYVKTMEFPTPVQLLLRFVVVHWGATQFLNKIGLSKAIPKQSSALYATSSAFGAICIKSNSDASFIQGGRVLQRVWLTATKLGLSLQPVTALPYLMQRIEEKDTRSLSKEHIAQIEDSYAHIRLAFNLSGEEKIALLFRLGCGDAPTAVSMKHPPLMI